MGKVTKCPSISANSEKVLNIYLLPIGSHRKVRGTIPYESDNKIHGWSNYCGILGSGPLMMDVHMHRPTTNSKHFADALGAFWPGLQVNLAYSYKINVMSGNFVAVH
jgi:hypothetical protein